jgi:predicted enzyme related to lactoylglutathione lyase
MGPTDDLRAHRALYPRVVRVESRSRRGQRGKGHKLLADTKATSGFAVNDLDAAKRFYGETLGLRLSVIDEENGLLALHLAGERDTIVYRKPDFVPATYTILNFEVDDIDGTVEELGSRGVSFERYDSFEQDEKGIARGNGPAIAWFKDPAGNILSVLEN